VVQGVAHLVGSHVMAMVVEEVDMEVAVMTDMMMDMVVETMVMIIMETVVAVGVAMAEEDLIATRKIYVRYGHLVLDELYSVWYLVIRWSETLFSRFPFVRNLPRALGTNFREGATMSLMCRFQLVFHLLTDDYCTPG